MLEANPDARWFQDQTIVGFIEVAAHEIRMFPAYTLGLIRSIRELGEGTSLVMPLLALEQSAQVVATQASRLLALRTRWAETTGVDAADVAEQSLALNADVAQEVLRATQEVDAALAGYDWDAAKELEPGTITCVRQITPQAARLVRYVQAVLQAELPRQIRARALGRGAG